MDSPHKVLVMWKVFPCVDIIMKSQYAQAAISLAMIYQWFTNALPEGLLFANLSNLGDSLRWLNSKTNNASLKELIHFSNVFHKKCNIFVCNWSNTMNTWSALWILMAWCLSTRVSVATVLSAHQWVFSCSWVKACNIISIYHIRVKGYVGW